jgi:hypothetical protein
VASVAEQLKIVQFVGITINVVNSGTWFSAFTAHPFVSGSHLCSQRTWHLTFSGWVAAGHDMSEPDLDYLFDICLLYSAVMRAPSKIPDEFSSSAQSSEQKSLTWPVNSIGWSQLRQMNGGALSNLEFFCLRLLACVSGPTGPPIIVR